MNTTVPHSHVGDEEECELCSLVPSDRREELIEKYRVEYDPDDKTTRVTWRFNNNHFIVNRTGNLYINHRHVPAEKVLEFLASVNANVEDLAHANNDDLRHAIILHLGML